MGSPFASASERRLRTTSPQPSPRTKPSAPASNVLQRPLADIILIFERGTAPYGDKTRLTPPARARTESPVCKLWQGRWTAISGDERALSTATLGACR